MGILDILKKALYDDPENDQPPVQAKVSAKGPVTQSTQSSPSVNVNEANRTQNVPKRNPLNVIFEDYEDVPQAKETKVSKNNGWIFDSEKLSKPQPFFEKRGIIILVVENTPKVNSYRNEVLRLANKIIEDNKSEFFLFLKNGSEGEFFNTLSYDELKSEGFPERLLFSNNCSQFVNLSSSFIHIYNFIKKYLGSYKLVPHNGKSYTIDNARIIFIGTGIDDTNADYSRRLLRLMRDNKCVKTIKYFCIKDEDAINAAKIGFPIIGHIESNFYK